MAGEIPVSALTVQPLALSPQPAGFVPSTPITTAGVIYVASTGALHYKSPAGTDTVIGPA